jgi:hypothetical protein
MKNQTEISKREAVKLLTNPDYRFHINISDGKSTFVLSKDAEKEFVTVPGQLLTTLEAAEILDLPEKYLKKLIMRKVLPAIIRIDKEDEVYLLTDEDVREYKEFREKGILEIYRTSELMGGYENSPNPKDFSRTL